jgi:hypothetical protein
MLHIYQTTRRHIPEDVTVLVQRRERLKSHVKIKVISKYGVSMLLRNIAIYLSIYQTARQQMPENLFFNLNDPSPNLLC